VVVLHTTLTDALMDEGIVRELISRVQARRKELGLEFTDRIKLSIQGGERAERVTREHADHIKAECLAASLDVGTCPESAPEQSLGEETVRIHVERQ
jgi:isoleucyl-tRNA synthetase